jgi:hypothetical protein
MVQQLGEAARHGDAGKGRMLLWTHGAQSFINYQDAHGATPLYIAAAQGHASVTKQPLAAHCNVDLQDNNGLTAMQPEEGHAGIATLIRRKRQEEALLGRRVVTNGLVAKPELNGRTAVSFDDDRDYSVELDSSSSSSLMIKPCNLLPTMKEKQDYTPVCSVALCSLLFSHV